MTSGSKRAEHSGGGQPRRELLITLSGTDAPGIMSEITELIAKHPSAVLLDVSQSVIHDLLSLFLLLRVKAETSLVGELEKKAKSLDLRIEHRFVDESIATSRPYRYAVTLLGDQVTAASLHDVTAALAERKANIEGIRRLSEGEFSCVEMQVASARELGGQAMRQELLKLAQKRGVDIALQAEGLYRRAKRLIVLDMDSTLIQAEVIDELGREMGVYDEIAEITHQAMAGKIDYDESLRRRCEKLAGMPITKLDAVYRRLELTPGAEDLIRILKKLGYRIAVLSGGFTFVADRLKERLGLDFAYANTLEILGGALTGRVIPPIVNAQRKADLLDVICQQNQLDPDQVIAVGDGANDLLMLERAGLGIAFNAKPAVRQKADLALSQKNLRSILYLLGLSAREIAELG